jgi:hypothetical protein
MDLFVVRVMVSAHRVAVVGMRVPGKPPTPVDMAIVLAPPDQHQAEKRDLTDV